MTNDSDFDPSPDDQQPDIDQQIRINELRESAREAAGGEMAEFESEDAPPEMLEAFWGNVLAYENAEQTCHLFQLEELGVEVPAPEEIDDSQLAAKLKEIFAALATQNTFFSQTDHLSDRELYEHLWHNALREATPDFPPGSGWNCHVDMLGGCSEEDMQNQLCYYADEQERNDWKERWPEDEIPPHVDPPYDRDRWLPKAEDG